MWEVALPERKLEEVSVDSLPQVFRGYDRAATRKLLDDLREVNGNLLRERVELERTLAAAEDARSELDQSQQRLSADLERMRTEYDALAAREQGLRSDLDVARKEIARFERRELLLTGMVEAAKRTSERMKSDAREEATKALKKARERQVEMLRRAESEVSRAARERARLSRISDQLRSDLSVLVTEVLGRYIDELSAAEDDLAELSATIVVEPEVSRRVNAEVVATVSPIPLEAVSAPAEEVVERVIPTLVAVAEPAAEDASASSDDPPADVAAEPRRLSAVFAYTARQVVIVAAEGLLLVGAVILVLALTRF